MVGSHVRQATEKDYAHIPNITTNGAILSLTATDGENDEYTGFIALSDRISYSNGEAVPDDSIVSWVRGELQALGTKESEVCFVKSFALCDGGQGSSVTHSLLQRSLHILGHCKLLLSLSASESATQAGGLSEFFTQVSANAELNVNLEMCSRNSIVPPLSIRRACVEDYEDLCPVLESAQQRWPPLAQLPEWCAPSEAFALARVIENQSDSNCVLVAEAKGKAVGFMVCSADTDLSGVRAYFDLDAYDNFMAPEEYATARERTITHLTGQQGLAAESITEMDIRTAMRDFECETESDAFPSTAFAAIMLCVDEEWESQATEFLPHAFHAFPEKDYCILTLPHEAVEPPFLGVFNHLLAYPIPISPAPEVLYVFHRHGLLEEINFRRAAPSDQQDVAELAGQQADAVKELDDMIVAECEGNIVGVVRLSRDVNMEALQADFDVRQALCSEREAAGQSMITMLSMNPIFAHRCRELLLASMREMDVEVLFYHIPAEQLPSDLLYYFRQMPGRYQRSSSKQMGNGSLFAVNKQCIFDNPPMVNSQIVVVGPSECGLSAIESLLLDQDLYYTSIMLLVPDGVSVGGFGNTLTARNLAKIGLESRVRLVMAEMVSLDREERIIGLSNGEEMNYDYLIITAGLKDQTRRHLQRTANGKFLSVVNVNDLLADSQRGLPERRENIIVYGATLEAYQALSILESRGSPRERVRHIIPDGSWVGAASCVKHAADKMEISLQDPGVMTLVEVEEAANNKLICVFEVRDPTTGSTTQEEEQCDMLVACDAPDINPNLFQCLNASSIIYDGRLVVDHHYQTNDPRIYAGGTIAKFSRRVASRFLLETCNSREVGQELAAALTSRFKEAFGFQKIETKNQIPTFHSSKAVGCSLPGSAFFVFAGTPEAMSAPSIEPPQGGKSFFTKSPDAFFQLNLDAHETVCSAVYCGRLRVSPSRLCCIVGLPASYLNNMVEKHEKGEIGELMTFLHEGWVEALYHDRFPALRKQLMDILANNSNVHESEDVEKVIEEAVRDFVQFHAQELPAYTAGIRT